MSDYKFEIQSHKGPYTVTFSPDGAANFLSEIADRSFIIADKKVLNLYRDKLSSGLARALGLIEVEALETNKDARKTLDLAEKLVEMGLRRDHQIIAIGGGIIQDITCFLASTLLRGVPWTFIPTTLLAQCDSCIGSKSSINLGPYKNILGTFLPPKQILIDTNFLKTLEHAELCSGIGEMLKVHGLHSDKAFTEIMNEYDRLFKNDELMLKRIRTSLEIKRGFIETDEFDKGIRNLLNYGHSFGHAVESATNFAIPHGVAVSLGLDMANFMSEKLGFSTDGFHKQAHPVLKKNYREFLNVKIPIDKMISALSKDKKNTASAMVLILRNKNGGFAKTEVKSDASFKAGLEAFFEGPWRD